VTRIVTIAVRAEIDRFSHNQLFAEELKPAFEARGWSVAIVDYMAQSKLFFDALRNPDCKFFLTFNGFGTELRTPTGVPGTLLPVFEAYGRPVVDLMHDCPAHESMAHQLSATYAARRLMITDYGYAGIAARLGVRNVTFVPSITFPATAARLGGGLSRQVEVLFPVGLSSPEFSRARLDTATTRGRVFRAIFDEVAGRCLDDWSLDPLVALDAAFAVTGAAFDYGAIDHRFLLTVVLDFVKFARRRQMLEALAGLPVTVVSDRDLGSALPAGATALEPRSATELLRLMMESRIVLCPTTHATGFHERPLSAFTAGAAVVSAPGAALTSYFSHRRDAMFFSNAASMRSSVEELLADRDLARSMGEKGRDRALQMLHPSRLVETILNAVEPA
jgi:hypothetical protein